jgi:SnoaL-like domain
MSAHTALEAWHAIVSARNPAGLHQVLAEDVVFHSPVVHTPQRGKAITTAYLTGALEVFGTPSFRYVREVVNAQDAILEFETEIAGVTVNGVDMIRWNEQGQIIEFKVMVRPLKAMQAVHEQMGQFLAKLAPGGKSVPA